MISAAKTLGAVAIALWVLQFAAAEDLKLRQEAVELLEHADAVSTPAVEPPTEALASFRWFNPDASAQDGTLATIISPGTGQRTEWHFGDFHLVNIHLDRKLAIAGENAATIPAAVRKVGELLPIRLVRFDHADTILAIRESEVHGRPARCIEFDTTYGSSVNANQICIDRQLGTMVRFKEGQETTENSEWFPFAGAYLPGRIDVFRHGIELVEIHSTRHKIEGQLDANVFFPPPGAEIKTRCHQVRRPFGQSMPQPPAGTSGSEITNVLLHGTIGNNGLVHGIVVDRSDRAELDREAIETVSRWVFTPALCDGKPTDWEANFVVHFQGR
jgi:TonB family protein